MGDEALNIREFIELIMHLGYEDKNSQTVEVVDADGFPIVDIYYRGDGKVVIVNGEKPDEEYEAIKS